MLEQVKSSLTVWYSLQCKISICIFYKTMGIYCKHRFLYFCVLIEPAGAHLALRPIELGYAEVIFLHLNLPWN